MKKWLDQYKSGGSANSLNRTVTCSNCGWSWKLSDGGKDPMTCHKCGGDIKMQNGGELDEYQDRGQVDFRNQLLQQQRPIVDAIRTQQFVPISEQEMFQNRLRFMPQPVQLQIRQGQKETPYSKQYSKERKAEELKRQVQRNSDLAKTFASFTPGNNIEAGVMGAETFANLNPVMSGPILATNRLASAIMHPTNNVYWGSDRSIGENALGVLGAAGDVAMVSPYFKGILKPKIYLEGQPYENISLKPTSSFKSEIDWSKWNRNTPKYPKLIAEYNQIEEATKKAGTWMKNPDGSPFQGTPEQFIQQQSSHFKKAFPQGFENVHRGVNKKNAFADFSKGRKMSGDRGIFTANPELAWDYANFHAGTPVKLNPFINDNIQGVYNLAYPKGKKLVHNANQKTWKDVKIFDNTTSDDAVELQKIKNYFTNANLEKITTNDLARYIPESDLNSIVLENINDGGLGDITIVNNRPGNYLKSLIGNVGFFDMSNPNIYKSLIPATGIGITAALQQKQQGDELEQYQNKGQVNFRNQLFERNRPVVDETKVYTVNAKIHKNAKDIEQQRKQNLYAAQIKQGNVGASPYQQLNRAKLNRAYINTHPYAKMDEYGNLQPKYINRTMEGVALPHTRAANIDQGLNTLAHGLDAAGMLTGVYDLGKAGLKIGVETINPYIKKAIHNTTKRLTPLYPHINSFSNYVANNPAILDAATTFLANPSVGNMTEGVSKLAMAHAPMIAGQSKNATKQGVEKAIKSWSDDLYKTDIVELPIEISPGRKHLLDVYNDTRKHDYNYRRGYTIADENDLDSHLTFELTQKENEYPEIGRLGFFNSNAASSDEQLKLFMQGLENMQVFLPSTGGTSIYSQPLMNMYAARMANIPGKVNINPIGIRALNDFHKKELPQSFAEQLSERFPKLVKSYEKLSNATGINFNKPTILFNNQEINPSEILKLIKLDPQGRNTQILINDYNLRKNFKQGGLVKYKQQGGEIFTSNYESLGLPGGPNNLKKFTQTAIISGRGQWDYPGQTTIIPSNQITMQGVNYPVLGVDNTGHQIMMQPGMDYTFPGQYVTEYPMAQNGYQVPITNNLFNRIFRDKQLIKQEILDENPALQQVMTLDNMNINYARRNQRRLLEKLNHNPEYFDKDNNQNGILDNQNDTDDGYPYSGNIYTSEGVIKNPNPGEFTTLINKRGMNRQQIKDAAANDFISHSLHYSPQYQDYSNKLNQMLLTKYPAKMIEENGGVDAYMRSIFTEDPSYFPYKEEMSFIDPNFINEIKSYVKGISKKEQGGEMIKRADGSYSRRGLWDNIRANRGSGKAPTKEMLEQERKIRSKYEQGGVVLNAGGEKHRIYVKSTNRGEGAKGHIMVNHPTMDKGMWDTIDLTEKAGATTIAQGVAATKKWHRENPYKKQKGGEQINKLKNINLNLPVIHQPEMKPFVFNKFLVNDRNQNLFIGGINPRYQNEHFSVGPYVIGVGNKYFQKFPAAYGISGTYHINDQFDINAGVGPHNMNAGINYNFQEGGQIPTVQGNFKKQNKYGYWVTDEAALAKEAQRLNSKKVLTEGGSLIIFDDNWNIVGVDDNPGEPYSNSPSDQDVFYKPMPQQYISEYDVNQYAEGGGIPERYRNMGFTKVGAKRQSTRPGKKWMVLAKKGDQYKVVHGGWKGMQDFKQHHSEQRRENFWSRMGGKNSSKATNPFSPLYWHKRFGTWEEGGQIPQAQDGLENGEISKSFTEEPSYYNNYIYRNPVKEFPCKGKGCAEQVSNELVAMGLNPQRTDAWFMNDAVIRSGGSEIWRTGNDLDYKKLRVGDIISLDRPGLHHSEKMKKNPLKYKPEKEVEHVGVIVGFDEQGVPLIKHGGMDENTVIQPITDVSLKVLSTGQDLNYKPYSIYRTKNAENLPLNEEYINKNYKDYSEDISSLKPLELKYLTETIKKQKFIDALNKNLENQSRNLNLTPLETQQLQKIAFGIFGNESTFGESQILQPKEATKRFLYRLGLTNTSPSLGHTRIKYDDISQEGKTKIGKLFDKLNVQRSKIAGPLASRDYNDEVNATMSYLAEYYKKLKQKDKDGNYIYDYNPRTNTVFGDVPIGEAVSKLYNNPAQIKKYNKKNKYSKNVYENIIKNLGSFPLFPIDLKPVIIKPNLNEQKIGGQSTLNPIVKKDNRNWLEYLKD